ncbi:single-stranded-DNA-specific exonuclease RecJ [Rodentibacter pneumotropicus]|uniref:Single-stranded-DNA-specific exonuclease RecJ n=1 Tax=Rodentibacter pneumotropicus TaxID=758 RepID=A0A448MNB8_9PAST|nr:single-stranded-DNA-specific exonuclease RecJ [Rodentibacter pneumotropicus]
MFYAISTNFNQTVLDWLDESHLQGIIWTDGELEKSEFTLETAELLKNGGPWGRHSLNLALTVNLKSWINVQLGKVKII